MLDLEKRVIALEAEVKLLKELLMSRVDIQITGTAPHEVAQCKCPVIGVPHQRTAGCLDSWATCKIGV